MSMVLQRPAWITLTGAALSGLAVALLVPLHAPMPAYYQRAITWATTGYIADIFAPLGYALLTGAAYKLAGPHGILALQAALHVVLTLVGILLLRQLGLPRDWSALGALTLALHPVLLLSVSKVWDVQLSALLFLLFVLVCTRLQTVPPARFVSTAVAAGLVFAAGVFCRPNYLLLFPALLLALRHRREPLPARIASAAFVLLCIVSAATYASLGIAAHGRVFFPNNGSYNLYAGHNPGAIHSLRVNLNAEPSLIDGVHQAFPSDPDINFSSPTARAFYSTQAMLFIRHHPAAELELLPLKLFTLFRPDTKLHPLATPAGFAQGLLALPALFFLGLLLLPRRMALQPADSLLFFLEAAYILPFLLTNSDPRFRLPLDALLLLHSVTLLHRGLQQRQVPQVENVLSTPSNLA